LPAGQDVRLKEKEKTVPPAPSGADNLAANAEERVADHVHPGTMGAKTRFRQGFWLSSF
jgi:hypothetical protein